MKSTLTAIFLILTTLLFGQCVVDVNPGSISINCGESVDLQAIGLSSTPALSTNFNGNQIGAGWQTTATLVYNNPCGPSLDGTPSAWFGNVPLPRTLRTNGFDLSCGGQVCFDLDFGGDDPGGGSNCEDPDEIDEGVYFQYSTNGGATWNTIFYFQPTPNITGPYYSWATYCYTLPPAAWSVNTMFQWDQPEATSSVNDHWGIDNVIITPTNCGYWYDWDNLPPSNDPATQTVSPLTTTTYNVTYTDGTDVCTNSITVHVNPLVADATTSASFLMCPNCADLDVSLVNNNAGSIMDDFDPGIDLTMWNVINNGTAGTGCGGVTGNGLHFDGTGTNRSAETIPINATVCANITFSMRMGSSGMSAPCENADAGEDVVLEYSINNGATWTAIQTYDEGLWDTNPTWQTFNVPIPLAAQTLNTIFRWRQVSFSSCTGCDNWSLDNVNIACAPPAYDYTWTPAAGLSDPNIQNPEACPVVPTTYTATITDPATGCSASDNVFIDVNCNCTFTQFTGIASNCINGNEFEITGSYTYVENPGTGTITIEATNASGTVSTIVNPPFVDGQVFNYSLNGLISDGSQTTVTISFSDDNQCDEQVTLTSPVLPQVTGISGGNTYCQGDAMANILVNVTGNGPFTVSYELDGVPASANGASSPISLGTSEGNYVITAINDQGCTNTAAGNDEIIIHPLPTVVSMTGGDDYCSGDPIDNILVEVTGSGPWDLTYTINGVQQTVNSSVNPIVLNNIPGTYIATVLSDVNCQSTVNATDAIVVLASPVVNAGADFIVCEGETITINGTGAATYVWDNGVTNAVPFVPQSTATYTVVGTDANGCIDDDQITVTVENLPLVNFVADVLQGCVPTMVTFENQSTGNIASCLWEFGDGNSSTMCGVTQNYYDQSGYFDVTLTLTTVNGCVNDLTLQDYIYIEDNPIASFNVSSQTLLSLDTDVAFYNTSSGAVDYVWDFGDNSPLSTIESPTHEYPQEQSGSYAITLYAFSPLGCSDTVVNYIKVTDAIIYYIPNTFTPDNDEFNQHFQPIFTAGFDPYDFNMKIYNRWGEIIFESNDASVGWDGTYGGKIVQDGTYSWKIEFKTLSTDERIMITGHVNIIR